MPLISIIQEIPGILELEALGQKPKKRPNIYTSSYVFLNHLTYNKLYYHFYWFSVFY